MGKRLGLAGGSKVPGNLLFTYSFFVVLGFVLRASSLLARHSTT
jgi:hypothetical protein